MESVNSVIDTSKYYSVKEAAQVLGLSDKTVRRRLDKGEIEGIWHEVKPGLSCWLIPKDSIRVSTTTLDTIPLTRAVSLAEVVQAVKAQMREENALILAENAQIKDELQALRGEVKEGQKRLEKSLLERDEKLMNFIRERQNKPKTWWKFWE